MSGEIRVNPPSVKSFGTDAQALFGSIRTQLQGLVDEAVDVQYYGPNAEGFKTECGLMASKFAEAIVADLQKMAVAVEGTTSKISKSLGGQPVTIQVDGTTIPVPAIPAGDGSVGINAASLETLKKTTKDRFALIIGYLEDNLKNLTKTDWTGNAKGQAVASVTSYTTASKGKVSEANTSFDARIDSQIQAANQADQH